MKARLTDRIRISLSRALLRAALLLVRSLFRLELEPIQKLGPLQVSVKARGPLSHLVALAHVNADLAAGTDTGRATRIDALLPELEQLLADLRGTATAMRIGASALSARFYRYGLWLYFRAKRSPDASEEVREATRSLQAALAHRRRLPE